MAKTNGRSVVYANSLSFREMASLTALCDTFIPSIHLSPTTIHPNDALASYYGTSASTVQTPAHLAGFLSKRLKHPKLWLLRLVLWILSTWMGTFILCGMPSLCNKFPYFQTFAALPIQKREHIMLSWSRSYFYLLRLAFRSLKVLILLIFFTQVDENDDNISWKAIGYCGPDPDRKTRKVGQIEDEEDLLGPLYKGLINLEHPRELVAERLQKYGFSVSEKHESKRMIIGCDAVVVGSGSGGGVVAGVLAKAGYKVVVLEKGQYCARANLSLLEGPTMNEMYLGGGLLATDDMGAVILAGSTVGGGSTINWAASIRTPQHVMNEWSDRYDLELFHSKLYNKALDIVCDKMGVQSQVDDEGLTNAVLRKGCLKLGYPVVNIPRNAPPDHYCGWCCLGCKDGKKKATSETWLVDLVNSGNGVILPGCEATKVVYSRKKGTNVNTATGVEFKFECGGEKEVYMVESKVTIVACGALRSPVLLKDSGLKNRNIGKNLHIHPVTMAWGYFPDEDTKRSYEGGIMTVMSTVVANFNKSGHGYGYGAVIQTPALHPGMFSVLMPWLSGTDMKVRMSKYSRTAHVFALARDKGCGVVASPSSISYDLDPTDEENLKRGIEKVLRILAAAGAEEIGTHNCQGKTLNVKKVSFHEFERFVKEESGRALKGLGAPICSAHQMGSCRMGVDPKESVVNPMGETWDVKGLFVADASVFPTALGVNPMVTVQAIAFCTAQSVLHLLSRKK